MTIDHDTGQVIDINFGDPVALELAKARLENAKLRTQLELFGNTTHQLCVDAMCGKRSKDDVLRVLALSAAFGDPQRSQAALDAIGRAS